MKYENDDPLFGRAIRESITNEEFMKTPLMTDMNFILKEKGKKLIFKGSKLEEINI